MTSWNPFSSPDITRCSARLSAASQRCPPPPPWKPPAPPPPLKPPPDPPRYPPPVEKRSDGALLNVRPLLEGDQEVESGLNRGLDEDLSISHATLSGARMVLSVSRADPEDVRFCGVEALAVFAVFALDPVCRFAVALARARAVALILLTVPFAFVT